VCRDGSCCRHSKADIIDADVKHKRGIRMARKVNKVREKSDKFLDWTSKTEPLCVPPPAELPVGCPSIGQSRVVSKEEKNKIVGMEI
jgi:hypothetical protein